jgi:hypothetical protein
MTLYPYNKKNDLPANKTLTVGELIQILQLHDPNSLLDFKTSFIRNGYDLTADGRRIITMIYTGDHSITEIKFFGFIE